MATNVLMPKQGNTVEECLLVSWRVKIGEEVKEGQIIADIETDKAVFELESPAKGTVLSLLCNEGDAVPVLQNVAVIGKPGEETSIEDRGVAEKRNVQNEAPNVADNRDAIPNKQPMPMTASQTTGKGISPRARNLALRKSVNARNLAGTGPGGRVIERDIERALESSSPATPLAKAVAAETGVEIPAFGSGIGRRILAKDLQSSRPSGDETHSTAPDFKEVSLRGVRKITSERLLESLRETAQLTFFTSADAQSLLRFRHDLKENGERLGLAPISIGDMVMFAVGRVLRKYPDLNATLSDNVYRRYANIHLAFACDTPRGLVVPVVPKAEELSLNDLASAIRDKAQRAKEGSIDPDSLQGGTFTVSNLGPLGIGSFTPILNYPQVTILGVGAIELKPVRKAGDIEYRDHMGLSLTVNHQVVDGWQASLFLKDLRHAIESFHLLPVL